jgi:hypothetical protein
VDAGEEGGRKHRIGLLRALKLVTVACLIGGGDSLSLDR